MLSEEVQIEKEAQSPVFTIKTGTGEAGMTPKQFWEQLRNYYRTASLPKGYKPQKLVSVFQSVLGREVAGKTAIGSQSFFQILDEEVAEYQTHINELFNQKSNDLITALQELLQVNERPQSIGEVYGFAAEVIAFDKLSGLIPETEGKQLTKSRSKRLVSVLEKLQQGLKYLEGEMATLISAESTKVDAKVLSHCQVISSKYDLFSGIEQSILEQIAQFIELIKAFRVATLEVDNAYKEDIHNDYFEHFSWYQLTSEERQLFHPFIVVAEHEYVVKRLDVYSRLLSTNWPINFVILNSQVTSPADEKVSWEDAAHRYRQELSMFTIAHRNVYTFQSTLVNRDVLVKGIRSCFHSTGPAMVHILYDEKDKLISNVGTASRYFPTINYNPGADPKAGPRLGLDGNDQPIKDWPEYELVIDEGIGDSTSLQLPFTYADYKALFPTKVNELMIIPPYFYSDPHLIALHEYLALDTAQLIGKVPFILLTDKDGNLLKAAVPNVWVVSCQERLDFWQFLREMGRVEGEIKEAEEPKATPDNNLVAALRQTHEQEIRQLKDNAVKQAAEKLLGVLLRDK